MRSPHEIYVRGSQVKVHLGALPFSVSSHTDKTKRKYRCLCIHGLSFLFFLPYLLYMGKRKKVGVETGNEATLVQFMKLPVLSNDVIIRKMAC